jgi:phage gpG-like protein
MGVKIIVRPSKKTGSIAKIPDAFKHISQYLRSRADRRIKEGVPPPNSPLTARVKQGDLTLRDNGTLMRSIAAHAGDLWADASTPLKYAPILQRGGTIRTKGKGLWIPAGPETRRLMKGLRPGELIQRMKSAGWKFYKKGGLFCAYRKTKSGKSEEKALFIIKKSVTIPARPFLHIDRADELYILNYLGVAIGHALEGTKT